MLAAVREERPGHTPRLFSAHCSSAFLPSLHLWLHQMGEGASQPGSPISRLPHPLRTTFVCCIPQNMLIGLMGSALGSGTIIPCYR